MDRQALLKARDGVLLVTPPVPSGDGRNLWLDDSMPHLGMAYLLAMLRQANVACALLDAGGHNLNTRATMARIREARPRLVALTGASCQLKMIGGLVSRIRAELPQTRIMLGGWHVTAAGADTLEWMTDLDYTISGEGEQAIVELWKAIEAGETDAALGQVPGLTWRLADGSLKANPRAWVHGSLDDLPFPEFEGFSLDFRPGLYGTLAGYSAIALPVTTSRGCPYGCEFCFRVTGRTFRKREIGDVVEEMKRGFQDYGARVFYIVDETFSLHAKRTMAFCEALIESGLPKEISWVCETRPDCVSPELVDAMARAGCKVISYGIDTGNQDMQEAIGRKLDLAVARRAIETTAKRGIVVDTNFILGHPHETWSTAMDTIKYALSIDAHLASFAVLVPFPGTDLIEKARAGDGLRLIDSDWNGYDKQVGGACEPLDMTIQQVQWLQRYAYLRFYLRPSRAPAVGRVFAALGPRNVATFMGRTVQTLLGTGGLSSAARLLRGNA
ncbi:MAG: B12-binding domain-containing radical SAM protein [Myxococcota bacterium]